MADRKWADNPNNPDYKDPHAEDIPKDEEGNLQWDNVEMPSDLDQKATSLWEHLNGLLKQWRPTEGEAIQYKKDLYTLMDDFLKSPDRPSPGAPEDDDDPGYMLDRPSEDPMGRGAKTSALRKKVMRK